ncbi:hypothetical protein MBANPS3_011068 [Mucor bainieri]
MESNCWADLPREIMCKMLRQFTRYNAKTLTQLQLTCKKWQPLAQNIMYETICLPPPESNKASLLLKTLQLPDKDYASMVKNIEFNDYSIPLGRNYLVQLIRLCPNVRSIVEGFSRHPAENYYQLLLRLYNQGYLRELEEVKPPRPFFYGYRDDTIEDYIRLMLALKEPAKQLYVPLKQPVGCSVSLIPGVEQFKRLEEVNFEENNDGISIAQLQEVLRDSHPLLKKLNVCAPSLVPIGAGDIITPMPQIKEVELHINKCSTRDLQLIQQTFPAINQLHIATRELHHAPFGNVGDDNDTEKNEMTAFFNYISQTEALFSINIASLRTDFLVPVLRIASTQLPVYSVAVTTTPPWSVPNQGSNFTITTTGNAFYGQLNCTKEGKPIFNVEIEVSIDQVSESLCLSLLKSINPRCIDIDTTAAPRNVYDEGAFGQHLELILSRFKNLKVLRLSNHVYPALKVSADYVIKTLQLDEVNISNCNVSAVFLRQLSRKINYIKILVIDRPTIEEYDLISNNLSMQYTSVDSIHLKKDTKSCKLSIILNTASAHLCFDERGNSQPATYYNDQDVPSYTIRFVALSEVKTISHHLILRSNGGCLDVFQKVRFQNHNAIPSDFTKYPLSRALK